MCVCVGGGDSRGEGGGIPVYISITDSTEDATLRFIEKVKCMGCGREYENGIVRLQHGCVNASS